MNKRLKSLLVPTLAGAVLAVSLGVLAQQAPKPEVLIKWRQSAFQVIAWNCGRIKASVEGQFNKDEVIKAANAIAGVANAGLVALFAPGTEQGKGWHDTTAKSELFKDNKRFAELNANFVKEANDISSIAASGDAAAVKVQFAKLTRTCKTCHDDFKTKE